MRSRYARRTVRSGPRFRVWEGASIRRLELIRVGENKYVSAECLSALQGQVGMLVCPLLRRFV